MKLFFLVISLILFFKPNPKRQIITDDYNYDFSIMLEKKNKFSSKRLYTWFKNGVLHTSYGGASGYLLDGKYTKTYVSGAIAEQGSFNNGVKEGRWFTWYPSGKKKNITHWKKGRLSGRVNEYSEAGTLILKGNYRKGKKQGVWIDFQKKDTLCYKSGKVSLKKEKLKKKKNKFHFFKIFKKRKPKAKKNKLNSKKR